MNQFTYKIIVSYSFLTLLIRFVKNFITIEKFLEFETIPNETTVSYIKTEYVYYKVATSTIVRRRGPHTPPPPITTHDYTY